MAAKTMMTDSPEHLAIILARKGTPMSDTDRPGETPEHDPVPEGLKEAMMDFTDAHAAGDHEGMAQAFRDAITCVNEPITEDPGAEAGHSDYGKDDGEEY